MDHISPVPKRTAENSLAKNSAVGDLGACCGELRHASCLRVGIERESRDGSDTVVSYGIIAFQDPSSICLFRLQRRVCGHSGTMELGGCFRDSGYSRSAALYGSLSDS